MAITAVMFDTEADEGSKLDPEVKAEIDFLAPSTIDSKDIKENMLDDESVTHRAIAPGAVQSDSIAEHAVETINYAAGSVDTAALEDDAVTAAKAGTGVTTAYDHSGNPVEDKTVYLTAAQYAGIATPDPNTSYYLVG